MSLWVIALGGHENKNTDRNQLFSIDERNVTMHAYLQNTPDYSVINNGIAKTKEFFETSTICQLLE